MTNYHSNEKKPVAIWDGKTIRYFESIKETANYIGCSGTLIANKINGSANANLPIFGKYIVDIEETEKIRRIGGVHGEKVTAGPMLPVLSASGITRYIKAGDLENPKLIIAKFCREFSIKTLSKLTNLSTKEVRKIFEECWGDPEYEHYVRG